MTLPEGFRHDGVLLVVVTAIVDTVPEVSHERASRQLDPARLGDHVDRLYRAALALCGNPYDAEDLVQDTYARVLAKPRILRRDDDLGYLLRVLRNTFLNNLRSARRRPAPLELDPERDGIARPGDPRHPEAALEVAELFGAIAGLPEDQRDAVVAVDVVGLSYAEAARALGAKEATITTRLHRGRQRLADGLRAPSHVQQDRSTP